MKSNTPRPIVVPPDSGKVLQFLGVTHEFTPQQTDSAYYLFEFGLIPKAEISLTSINLRMRLLMS